MSSSEVVVFSLLVFKQFTPHCKWVSLLSDVSWSKLSFTLSQEDLHGTVQQVDAELPFLLCLPVGHDAIEIPSLLIREHLQPCNS